MIIYQLRQARPVLVCFGALMVGGLAPSAVLAQVPASLPPNMSGGAQGYSAFNPVQVAPYGTGTASGASYRLVCAKAEALTGVEASNDHEAILRFGGGGFFRVGLSKACPALVAPGAHVVGVSRGARVLCEPVDVQLKVAAADGTISKCSAATLSWVNAGEATAAFAPAGR
jgi:hypothetical protein